MPGATQDAPKVKYPSPLNDPGKRRESLPLLLDKFTTSRSQEIPGRINVNTAPYAVLAGLPGLNDSDVQNIIARRPRPGDASSSELIYKTPAWLVTEANLAPSKVQAIDRYVTARTQVYRVQTVGYLDQGGPSARLEAVIDANQGYPRILYRRDLSEFGKGFQTQTPAPP
jgi:type II secretory pathway component PulK